MMRVETIQIHTWLCADGQESCVTHMHTYFMQIVTLSIGIFQPTSFYPKLLSRFIPNQLSGS